MATLTAAAVQMTSTVGADENIEAVERLVGRAAEAGARYVLTPEVTLNFADSRARLAEVATREAVDAALDRFAGLAKAHAIFLHAGSAAVPLSSGKFANRSMLFGPDGSLLAQYDKIHLFDADVGGDRRYRESATYAAGEEAVMADLPGFRLGLTVCYDLRFPSLYWRLALAGATVFSVPAAFTVPTGRAHWETLLRARAIETGCYVVAAAQAGSHENGRQTWGHSMIVGPRGEVLALSDADGEDVIVAALDPDEVLAARAEIPNLVNVQGFSLSVNQEVP